MRYFIIFYNWWNNAQEGSGNTSYCGSFFPNRKEVKEYIAETIKTSFKLPSNIPSNYIVITNIIELDKEDYEEWFRE